MSPVTTHVLVVGTGVPDAGVRWNELAEDDLLACHELLGHAESLTAVVEVSCRPPAAARLNSDWEAS